MYEESSVQLLLSPDNNKKTDLAITKSRKLQHNRAANALFCGLILGFVFSFLVAYSGVVDDNFSTNSADYSVADFISNLNNTSSEVDKEAAKNVSLLDFLYKEVRVLCFMLPVSKAALTERGDIFLKTWTKRCHKFIFFTDEPDDTFADNVVVLSNKENNWQRMREGLLYIHKHHLNDFDWILKTNDNSYIVMENLRWLLYQYENDWPVLIGQRFLKEDYMIGVYAISKLAFVRLIENGFSNDDICDPNGGTEDDKMVSKCLQRLNVLQIDALDDEGKGMFFPNSPEIALFPEKVDADYDKWWWHKIKQGSNCCSDRLISIQNVWNTHLYYMEYFIYKVHAFGRHRLPEPLPKKKTLEEIVKEKF